ncbi:hypothetical protein ACWDPV_05160 [Gordonia sp. NPDC003504]
MAEPVAGVDGAPSDRATPGPRVRRLVRAAATVVGTSAVFACAAGVFAHYSGLVSSTASRVAAFIPVLVVAGIVGFVVLLLARRWIVAGVAAVVVAAGVVTQAPLYVGASSASDSDLVVMQANIYLGQADIVSLASTVRAEDVDLLTIVELTEGALTGGHIRCVLQAGIDIWILSGWPLAAEAEIAADLLLPLLRNPATTAVA